LHLLFLFFKLVQLFYTFAHQLQILVLIVLVVPELKIPIKHFLMMVLGLETELLFIEFIDLNIISHIDLFTFRKLDLLEYMDLLLNRRIVSTRIASKLLSIRFKRYLQIETILKIEA